MAAVAVRYLKTILESTSRKPFSGQIHFVEGNRSLQVGLNATSKFSSTFEGNPLFSVEVPESFSHKSFSVDQSKIH